MTLPALLGTVKAILQADPLCRRVRVIETKEFSPEQFLFKLRADLPKAYKLQVRIYCNQGHIDYAYQLFTTVPVLRWDNKEEFHHLESYPHHHHDEHGNVDLSPLTGDPSRDLALVLHKVAEYLAS
jgi:hypothetical protein